MGRCKPTTPYIESVCGAIARRTVDKLRKQAKRGDARRHDVTAGSTPPALTNALGIH
jgi:hypothetical protein